MRVLFTSTAGTGHVHPMVTLAMELRARSHEVLWATAPLPCQMLSKLGMRVVPAGLDLAARRALVAAAMVGVAPPLPRSSRSVVMPIAMGRIAAPAMHDALVQVFDDFVPDVVVHDLAELAAAPIATERRIAHVTVGYSGALSDQLYAVLVDSAEPLWARHGLSITARAFHGDLLLHPLPRSVDTPRTDGPSVPMRPVAWLTDTSLPVPDWITSFGATRPGIYVTFGTEVTDRAPWAAIFEAAGDIDADVVATIGAGTDPHTIGPTPRNIRLERYIPQALLLHRARIMISHAGAGTMIGAACAGKPQISVPIAADQWDNADLVSRAGAGITLETDERSPSDISRAIAALLNGHDARNAAARLASDLAALPHPHEVAITLEQLFDQGTPTDH